MRVCVLSALGGEQQTVRSVLSARHPGLACVDYVWDTAGVRRRVTVDGRHRGEVELEPADTAEAAVADDLDQQLAVLTTTSGVDEVLVVLPFGCSARLAVDRCLRLGRHGLTVGSVLVAVDPNTVEDQLWSHQTLAHQGLPVSDGDLSGGEFLVAELLLADTHVLVLGAGDWAEGAELVRQIAPQSRSTVVSHLATSVPWPAPTLGHPHDLAESAWRVRPGTVTVPALATGAAFGSHLVRASRPLHPERLVSAMHDLGAGCVWSRGRMWIASAPGRKVGWLGVGPHISFLDAGVWPADQPHGEHVDPADAADELLDLQSGWGDRSTLLAFTARLGDLDCGGIDEALRRCELTDTELAAGLDSWTHAPDPLHLEESFATPPGPPSRVLGKD